MVISHINFSRPLASEHLQLFFLKANAQPEAGEIMLEDQTITVAIFQITREENFLGRLNRQIEMVLS